LICKDKYLFDCVVHFDAVFFQKHQPSIAAFEVCLAHE
jgi:hypothetical protein